MVRCGLLGWLRRKAGELRRRRRVRSRIISHLVSKGVARRDAERLAPLVMRGELTVSEAVSLGKKLGRDRVARVERRLRGEERRKSGSGGGDRFLGLSQSILGFTLGTSGSQPIDFFGSQVGESKRQEEEWLWAQATFPMA
ncbi:hypothetical protein apy_11600 [Aeropyrum pernix]|uniref:Uncharacterized protein n=1 Tax=Aeropyrum pernix TaxID=56636 RepID=A0A401HAE1_AERPX|nr:hypothetical protein apy_11600 [Aeropyrum pernix]